MNKHWKGTKYSVFNTIGASNHADGERADNDYYATDPIAIDKLFAVETFADYIWECACGEGHLSERMKEYGKQVYSTDIIYRGGYSDMEVKDFLVDNNGVGAPCDIITNPPYKYAKEFVEKAIELTNNKVAMFLKLTFLEGVGRKALFEKTPPSKVYVFSKRVLCAKNGDFKKMREEGSAVAYAWFIWEKNYKGDTIVKWL